MHPAQPSPTSAPSAGDSSSAVRPTIGPIRGTALYVSAVVGPGILTLPALAADAAGPAFLVALVALLLLSVPLAHGFASLGIAHGGGTLPDHVGAAFGSRAGRLTTSLFYFGVAPGVGALALFGAHYLASVTGAPGATPYVAVGLILLAWALNAQGLRASASAQVVMTLVLITVVVLVALTSAPRVSMTSFDPVAPHGWGAVGGAAFLLVWVLTGWEASANFADALSPTRLRRIVWAALAIIALAFLGLSVAMVGVLGTSNLGDAPVATLLDSTLGSGAVVVGVALAVLLTVGNMNAYMAALAALGSRLSVTRRLPGGALTTPAMIAVLAVVLTAGRHDAASLLVGITAASQVPVLILGAAAASRLSTGWARVPAVVATVAVALLLIPAGTYLIAPAMIAAATGVATLFSNRRSGTALPRTSPFGQT